MGHSAAIGQTNSDNGAPITVSPRLTLSMPAYRSRSAEPPLLNWSPSTGTSSDIIRPTIRFSTARPEGSPSAAAR